MIDSIWLCGDVHGDLRTLHRALQQAAEKPLAAILLGDLDPPLPVGEWLAGVRSMGVDTWFIHGNHETDSEDACANIFDSAGCERNLHGRVQTIGNLRFAGLGGVFRSEIWYPPAAPSFDDYSSLEQYWWHRTPRHQRLAPGGGESAGKVIGNRMRKHRSSIFPKDYDELAAQQADVLIVHEAPDCHPRGFEAIDELACAMGARWVVHGHHHDALDYSLRNQAQGFHAIGVGLRGITTLSGRQVVPGELDAQRAVIRKAKGQFE